MEIEELEKAFIAWMNDKIPDLPAESFPDNPAGYDLLRDCVVLVRYNGTTFGNPETLGMTSQTGETEFILSVMAFSLTNAAGIYDNLSKICRAVQGKTFNGSTPVKIKNIAFAGVDNARWQYDVTVSFDLPAIEPAEDAPFNLVKHITVRNAHDEIYL